MNYNRIAYVLGTVIAEDFLVRPGLPYKYGEPRWAYICICLDSAEACAVITKRDNIQARAWLKALGMHGTTPFMAESERFYRYPADDEQVARYVWLKFAAKLARLEARGS